MTALVSLGLAISIPGSVHAASANFVQNGDFTLVTGGTNGKLGDGTGLTATDWTNGAGYNFVFNSATEATTGSGLDLYGGNGFTNSPTGGNFIGLDGAYPVGNVQGISQNIGNSTTGFLTVGDSYILTFYQAAGQQQGFSGATTDYFNVSLGNAVLVYPSTGGPNIAIASTTGEPVQVSSTMNNVSGGFVPWTQQTMVFTATSSQEVLTFLASGTPAGTPPFALLDGVSLVAVPEPSPLIAMVIGILGLGLILFKRYRRTNTAK